ncbi:MAG: hypothetical protein KF744_12405 [Taibaiella sp.]|nr:hypothetical protein [Taibaiella sp.]
MKRIFPLLALLVVFCSSYRATAQQISPQDMEKLHKMEDSLVFSADSMFNALIPDSRPAYSEKFARQLVRALKIPNSYWYPFDTLKKMVNIVIADDNAFRIFNWEIEPTPTTRRYYGAIQLAHPDLKLVGLNDYSAQLDAGLEDSVLPASRWFGALYYRIIAHDVNGQKVYTLFGLNSGSTISNRKILDALTFTPKGVTFGAPIFGVGSTNFARQPVKRFVLEYKKDVTASMNWDPEQNMIVFDRLASVSNDPSRKYTYVPTGQYDGFAWSEGMWNLHKDIMQITILKDGEAPNE